MKNFDLDQLEKKNIYTTPDNFFADMQKQVLSQTVHQIKPAAKETEKKGAIVPLKWWYASAAAVALIFGAVFFVNSDNSTEQLPVAKVIADPVAPVQTAPVEEIETTVAQTPEPQVLAVVEPAPAKIEKRVKAAETTQKSVAVKTKAEPKPISIEEEMELLLEAIPQQELVSLTANDQTDIYLDLYY